MIKKCKMCGKEFETKHKTLVCSKECRTNDNTIQNRKYRKIIQLKEGKSATINCKECEYEARDLKAHITRIHKMTTDQYKEKHGDVSLICEDLKKYYSDRVKGENNPGFRHNGKLSPFSKEFYIKKGYSDEESISMSTQKQSSRVYVKGNSSNQKEYWVKKGYSEEDAIKKVSERQSTFTLEKCIKKYGEIGGRERWEQRQKKWQDTLKSKPTEEIERINRAKMWNGNGYSKISQELFKMVYDELFSKYPDMRFATLDNGKINTEINNEYIVMYNNSCSFLDFYIPSLNKCIEFDGDYWHTDKQKDIIRENNIKQSIKNIKFLRISETEYRNNPKDIAQKCIAFLGENNACNI